MSQGHNQITAISGIVFVALFVSGMIVLDIPGHDDSDEIVNAFYGEGSNRARVVVAAYLLAGAALAYLLFATLLWGQLKVVEREPAVLTTFMLGAALVFAGALFLTGTAQGPTYALYIDAFDEPHSQLSRAFIPHLGFAALIYGMLAAAASIAAASLVILRAAALPRWLAWSGFLTAFLLLFGMLFTPMIALPIWVLVVSVTLFITAGRTPSMGTE